MKLKILIVFLFLNGCYSSKSVSVNSEKPIIKKDKFEEICSKKSVSFMKINSELVVWGFDPLLSSNRRKCYKINLQEYKNLTCQFEIDLIGNSGIHLYKNHKGWYKFIYKDENICKDSLEIYLAQSE